MSSPTSHEELVVGLLEQIAYRPADGRQRVPRHWYTAHDDSPRSRKQQSVGVQQQR